MDVEIITVGTELLLGSTVNTNGPYIGRKLTELGYNVRYHQSVQDHMEDMKNALDLAMGRGDIIIFSGGLGPTKDDATKEAVAEYFHLPLIFDEKTWMEIQERGRRSRYVLTENNKRQAYFIQGSQLLDNPNGSAKGSFLSVEGKYIFLLPGPPNEFEPMVAQVLERLPEPEAPLKVSSLHLTGIGESHAESLLRELDLENDALEIETYASYSEVEVKIMGRGLSPVELEAATAKVSTLLKGYVFSDNSETAAETVVRRLQERGETLSFAESITGGLLSSMITKIPGASSVFHSALVTYSDDQKEELLGVRRETLASKSAVSREVAEEMALGLYQRTGAHYTLSLTGEAGPSTNTQAQVGTVFLALAYQGKLLHVEELHLNGSRETIQLKSAKNGLSLILQYLMEAEHGK
ncbi:MAG: competence/damage-inducible protein A [Tissierellia bacterium]|nr:competence/damage-inducible protein A [Tissierellia bacterium]